MRGKLLVAALAGALGVLGGWLIGRQPAPVVAEAPKASEPAQKQPTANVPLMPMPRELDPIWRTPPATVKAIPLAEIYSSVTQEELKLAPFGRDKETLEEWRALRDVLIKHGRPTTFVLRAFTIHGAITDTLDALESRRPMTRLAPARPDEANHLWAFVYIGNGSNSPAWNIQSVAITGSDVTLRYRSRHNPLGYGTSFPHAYWIPLGQEHSSTITMRVVDGADECEVLKLCTRLARN